MNKIEQLVNRYGNTHNYDSLSSDQQKFLLNPIIKNFSDSKGYKTMFIKKINCNNNENSNIFLRDIYLGNSESEYSNKNYASKRLKSIENEMPDLVTRIKQINALNIIILADESKINIDFQAKIL